jgi:hypothetical protein
MHTLGYIMFAVAALIAASNFYLSFVRAPVHWCLGWECPNISGVPVVGSLFLVAAVALVKWSAFVWLGVLLLCAIDTGGVVWFCLVMAWEFTKKK